MPESIQWRLERTKEEMEEALNKKDDDRYYTLEVTKKQLEKSLKELSYDDENE